MTDTMLPEERIYHCLQQLGVRRAHFAGRGARESGPLLQAHPQLVASLSLVSGTRAAEVPVEYARRVCCVRGDFGEGVSELRESGLVELGIREIVMRSCEDAGWTDTAAERPQEVLEALLAFWRDVEQTESIESVHLAEAEGALEGITFRTLGRGTPVVLLPLYLAPSQWEPLVGNLSAQHTVVLLGGPELVPLSSLEWRARSGYLNVVRSVIQETKLRPGERVLEVGCGSGALVRWLSRHTEGQNPIDALDISPYLLSAARALARKEGVDNVAFQLGNAEQLPYPDASFDVTFSSTVMEEVDADQMLAEMVRVTNPGGRIGIVVRATDLPGWTRLPLSPGVRAKIEQGGGGVGPKGCADASLYERLKKAGLVHTGGYPQFGLISPDMARWSETEPGLRRRLTMDEQAEWTKALEDAERSGRPFWYGPPFHCATGTKPA